MKVHAILKRFLLCVEFKWTQFIRATPSWVAIELLNRSYSSGHFLNANNHHNVFAKQSPTFVGACCKVTYHTVNQKYGESSASFAGLMDCWTCFLFKWGLWSFSWTIKSPYAENLSLTECSPKFETCVSFQLFLFLSLLDPCGSEQNHNEYWLQPSARCANALIIQKAVISTEICFQLIFSRVYIQIKIAIINFKPWEMK